MSRGAGGRPTLPEAIADFLSFSRQTSGAVEELRRFSLGQWEQTLTWLHNAGLALYFLQKLRDAGAAGLVPMSVLSRLEKNRTANQQRVVHMAEQFRCLNQSFDNAGVKFAVIKGFSLIPQFCRDACLRHQADFDYLVDDRSLPAAQRVVEGFGYSMKKRSAEEFVFAMPSARIPATVDELYCARAPHAVELHLTMWDSELHGVPLARPRFHVDRTIFHHWQGLVFPVLDEEDAFLLQVIHVLHHIFTYWVRMSSLLEVGYFLNQRAHDSQLWNRIEARVGDDLVLREFAVVVTEIAAQFCGAPIPPTVRIWGYELRPAVRVWIDTYARRCDFGSDPLRRFNFFPCTKLILFLHQQYLPEAKSRRRLTLFRLLPFKRSVGTEHSTNNQPSFPRQWRRLYRRQHLFRRLIFHLTAGLRYAWEIPRWRRLNRIARHLAPLEGREVGAGDISLIRKL